MNITIWRLMILLPLIQKISTKYENSSAPFKDDFKLEKPNLDEISSNEVEQGAGGLFSPDALEVSDIKEAQKDIKMLKNLNKEALPLTPSEDILAKKKSMDEQNKKFLEAFKLDDEVSSLADKNMWERLYNFIKLHLKDFLVDGNLCIPFEIRYVYCSYVVAQIPAQIAFVIPGFYRYLIPKNVQKISIIYDALEGMDRFLDFARKNSQKSLFITFFIGRKNSLLEDIEFIKNIPDLLTNNPQALIRELLEFKIRAQGYE